MEVTGTYLSPIQMYSLHLLGNVLHKVINFLWLLMCAAVFYHLKHRHSPYLKVSFWYGTFSLQFHNDNMMNLKYPSLLNLIGDHVCSTLIKGLKQTMFE